VLLVLLAIAHSAVLLAFLSQADDYKALAQMLQDKLDNVQAAQKSQAIAHQQTEAKLSSDKQALRDNLTRTEADLTKTQAAIASLKLELGKLTTEKGTLQQEFSRLNASLALAQEAQKHALSRLDAARNSANQLAAENAQLETQLSELTADVNSLRAEVRSQKERIYSLQSEVRKSHGLTTSPVSPAVSTIISAPVVSAQPIRGKVTEVNQAENIAQINVGEIAGVAQGTRFIIYRGSQYVGDLRITRVLRDQSLGTILLSSQAVMVGDQVATELE